MEISYFTNIYELGSVLIMKTILKVQNVEYKSLDKDIEFDELLEVQMNRTKSEGVFLDF